MKQIILIAICSILHWTTQSISPVLTIQVDCHFVKNAPPSRKQKVSAIFCTGINGIFTSQVTNDRISALAQSFAEKGFKVTVGIVNNKGETPRYLVPYMCAKDA